MSSDKAPNYMTPFCYDKLCEEREYLQKIERPKVIEVVSWAASLGDRSENADYQYGKKRLREIDRRVRFLNTRINTAKVINPLDIVSDKVQFGATIKVCVNGDKIKTLCIVGADEIDPANGLISWKSPIGRALIGKEVGDICDISTPNGDHEYEVVAIKFQEIKRSK